MEAEYTLWETSYWRVILSEDQLYLGRAVVVAKSDPRTALSELTPEEWTDLADCVIKPYERCLKTAFGAELSNWTCLMNLAYRETPPTPHVHWHVRGRYSRPVDVAGERFKDEAFGSHYEIGRTRTVSPAVMEEIARQIRAAYLDKAR